MVPRRWWAKARSVIVERAQLAMRLCPPYEFSRHCAAYAEHRGANIGGRAYFGNTDW